MNALRVYQVDAFTTQRYQGNPAGVVANAEGLGDRAMLEIARELNNSETAFILPASGSDHDVHVRFFTPTTEVPVCGHATVAAHYVMALEGRPLGSCRQLTGAGVQGITVSAQDDDVLVRIEQGRPTFDPPLDEPLVATLLAALGLAGGDIDPRCPVQFVSTGHGKVLLGVRDRSVLQALAPDPQALIAVSGATGKTGFFVFTLDTPEDDPALTWGRMFAPAIGIHEDPATGNANGPLGAYLAKHGLIATHGGSTRFRARQTAANGRSGWMDVAVDAQDGEPSRVAIEGRAVLCFETTLPRS
jgi:PhzF family phenazine biosynthesis protein